MSNDNVNTVGEDEGQVKGDGVENVMEGESMELKKVKEDLAMITTRYEDLVGKLRDRVECPVCMEVPKTAPIYVCSNGHVVCVSCVRNTCPVCRTRMVRKNNILALTVVKNIEHQCKDCYQDLDFESLIQHQKECEHRLVKCPDLYCDNMISLSSVKDHVVNGCVGKATIHENIMPCNFYYSMDSPIPVGMEFTCNLKGVYFEEKMFLLKITRRQLDGRNIWVFYVQMNGNAEATSNFGATILVFQPKDSSGEGKHFYFFSGDICPIDISSVEDAEDQGYCLTVWDSLMSKLLVEEDGVTRFGVRINIVQRSNYKDSNSKDLITFD